MITILIFLLIVLLCLLVIYYVCSMFLPPQFMPIVGAILGLIFLLVALQKLGVLPGM